VRAAPAVATEHDRGSIKFSRAVSCARRTYPDGRGDSGRLLIVRLQITRARYARSWRAGGV